MTSPAPNPVRSDVEIANVGADSFLRLYYNAYDSSSQSRRATVAKFYREGSTMNWNGTPLAGADAIGSFIAKMPLSKHEVLSYDCHAIPGSVTDSRPPSLLITVSGQVMHGPLTLLEVPISSHSVKNHESAPRTFSQAFVLIADEAAPSGGEPKYYVQSDSFRFVG